MSDFLQNAIRAGLGAIKASHGVTVTIGRGNDTTEVTAIPAEGQIEIESGDGFRARRRVVDYLIDAEDYDFGDGPVEPEAGDTIEDGEQMFECCQPSEGVPAWDWSDRRWVRYRIHYRQI